MPTNHNAVGLTDTDGHWISPCRTLVSIMSQVCTCPHLLDGKSTAQFRCSGLSHLFFFIYINTIYNLLSWFLSDMLSGRYNVRYMAAGGWHSLYSDVYRYSMIWWERSVSGESKTICSLWLNYDLCFLFVICRRYSTYFSADAIDHVDGLVQERCNSIANAPELHLSWTNPSMCAFSRICFINSEGQHRCKYEGTM